MFKLLKKSSVIRESLVEVINKSGETKKEIARQINVSQQSLSDWTTLLNTKPVTLENAQALTDHFRDSDFTLQVIHEFFGLFKSIDGDVYRRDPSSLDKLQMIESDERKQKKQEVEKILLKQVNYLTVDDRQQIISVEMQTAVTSDEKVFRLNENEELIEETTLSEMEPERKTVEPVMDQPAEDSDIQTGLFDASNPPLNK
ncbi:TPA: hypothetical protein QFF52_000768 [Enterococcus faecium]